MRDVPIVLGTAGHIDHGKTSLVRALTGIDTDRLAVEKARGITTELGFAHLAIGERRIAVVDVPGHERFVKSMVAGASGLDLVMLAIAADEGVMPQTREHLEICQLLGVQRGIVALTKTDLVDDEWRTMIEADVRAVLAGTFLERAEILGVSTKQDESIARLRKAIGALVNAAPARAPTGVFRLPIDRVFTIKGFGTVVTGTILGGTIATGDEITVIPSGLRARVRGIEIHGGAAERAHAGLRVAINLTGVAVDDLARGDMLAHVDSVAASHILDVELATPMPRQKVLLHHAATQVLATLDPVEPETRFAQLRLDARTPIGALPGDRFILRGFVPSATHGTTIGGGTVVRALAPRAKHDEHGATVAALATARSPEARIALEVAAASAAGLAKPELVRRLGLPVEALVDPLATLVASGELLVAGEHYLHATAIAALETKLVAALGQPRETIRAKLPAALPARAFDAIVDGLVRRNLVAIDGEMLVKATAAPKPNLSPAETELLAQFAAWGLEPPRPDTLARPVLDRLLAQKLVTKIKPDYIVHAGALAELRARLVAHLDQHGTIDPAQYKLLTNASRKFTIPLAEHFDAEKLTLRVGDLRRKR